MTRLPVLRLAVRLVLGLVPFLGAGASFAQGEDEVVRIAVRVTQVRPSGLVEIDRGRSDGLAAGDLVVLEPRGGGALRGAVVHVGPRSSMVELDGAGLGVEPGTRGEAHVPRARLEPPAPPPDEPPPDEPPAAAGPEPAEEPAPAAEKPPIGFDPKRPPPAWSSRDESYRAGMPLLSRVASERPSDRPRVTTGRVYYVGRGVLASDDHSSSLHRLGGDLETENPFGLGGVAQIDVEGWTADAEEDQGSDDGSGLRVERFSYALGGNRFDPARLELGRFLHHRVPELGFLDGAEWSVRRPSGDRFGASVGFLPEPDEDFDTGEDFALSAWYEWAPGDAEELAITGAVQKTWHNGAADRDLLLGKLRWLPGSGWDVLATAWVDYYTSGDEEYGSGVELTQAIASVGRSFGKGNRLVLSYTRFRFPDIEREELVPPLQDELAEIRSDRIELFGSQRLSRSARVHGEVGAWDDEDDSGADASLGFELVDVLGAGSRADLSVYGALGKFSRSGAVRASYGRYGEDGRWEVFYELSGHDQLDFVQLAEVVQHRLQALQSLHLGGGWEVVLDGGVTIWEDEIAATAGLLFQRSL